MEILLASNNKNKHKELLKIFQEFGSKHTLIVYEYIPISLPDYLHWFEGNGRLRSSHLDSRSLVSSYLPTGRGSRLFENSFFYRTHSLWNSIPADIREVTCTTTFKARLKAHLWQTLIHDLESEDPTTQ